MKIREIDPPLKSAVTLLEAPAFARLTARTGVSCKVWKNPSSREFAGALALDSHITNGLRGMATSDCLYVWQNTMLLHGDFVRQTGVDGAARLGLRSGRVMSNDETAAFPESFPWIFGEDPPKEIDERRGAVETWLMAFQPLRAIYPGGFAVGWYL